MFLKETISPFYEILHQGTSSSHYLLEKLKTIVGESFKVKFTKFKYNKMNNKRQSTKDMFIKLQKKPSNVPSKRIAEFRI